MRKLVYSSGSKDSFPSLKSSLRVRSLVKFRVQSIPWEGLVLSQRLAAYTKADPVIGVKGPIRIQPISSLYKNFFFRVFIGLGVLGAHSLSGQATYIDPTTTAALLVYSDQLKGGQEKMISEQKGLRGAQSIVAGQLAVVTEIQNTVLLGLKEVSTTLQNSVQVKEIFEDLEDCRKQTQVISKLVARHPQYAVFGARATSQTLESIMLMSSEVSTLLTSGNLNLATAGDRYRLLYSISQKVKSLKLWLFTIALNLERAERLGFLRAINPFSTYISTDKTIVQSILNRYKTEY